MEALMQAYEARFPCLFYPWGFVSWDGGLWDRVEAAIRTGEPLPYSGVPEGAIL
jgi:hypothetical protein